MAGDKEKGLEAKLGMYDENRRGGMACLENWWEMHLLWCGLDLFLLGLNNFKGPFGIVLVSNKDQFCNSPKHEGLILQYFQSSYKDQYC